MKRLFLLLGLLLAIASPTLAQTKFDTIYFEFEIPEGIDSSRLSLSFSGGILEKVTGFEINNGKENIKPKYFSDYNSFSVYGKGYVRIYTSSSNYCFYGNSYTELYIHRINASFSSTNGSRNGFITSLDVSSCSALTKLGCSSNQLTSLDVSSCSALKILWCGDNQLTSLDVSGCSALKILSCDNNQLTSLDLSNQPNLRRLESRNNRLTTLSLSNRNSLEELWCDGNQLTSLNLSNYIRLKTLICGERYYGGKGGNLLTSLDVNGCSVLEELVCSSNQLTSLDVSGCSALKELYCNHNQLTSLNLSGCSALKDLECYDNQLSILDVSDCSALEVLYCGPFSWWIGDYKKGNLLTSLDVSHNTNLRVLYCAYNQLKTLNVNYTLITLDCANNHIPLYQLYDIYNQRSEWRPFNINPQSDTIVLTINQPLDLSYEKALDGSLSSFNVTNEWGGELSSDWYTENDFTFRFLKQGQYRLVIKKSKG